LYATYPNYETPLLLFLLRKTTSGERNICLTKLDRFKGHYFLSCKACVASIVSPLCESIPTESVRDMCCIVLPRADDDGTVMGNTNDNGGSSARERYPVRVCLQRLTERFVS